MGLFEKDASGNVKNTPKNTMVLFGGILLSALLIYAIFPKEFKKK